MDIQSFFAMWTFEPTVIIGLVVAAFLYWWGARYSIRRGLARHLRWWRAACFAGGLLVIFLALESPIDAYSDQYLWTHMLQHELLTLVAPPLLLLGEPAWPMWRAFPPSWRRAFLRWAIRRRWPRSLGETVGHWLSTPWLVWILFIGVFDGWHLPVLYEATLENDTIHVLEHIMFLATATLFWAQVIPSRPLEPRLGFFKRAVFLSLAALQGDFFGLFFLFASTPIYQHYAQLPRTPSMITATEDVHYAGGVMDMFDTFILASTIMVMLGLWLLAEEAATKAHDAMVREQRQALANSRQTGLETSGRVVASPSAQVSAPPAGGQITPISTARSQARPMGEAS